MKTEGKKVLLAYVIVIPIFYVCTGVFYYYYYDYDVVSVMKLLAIQTLLLMIGGAFVVAVVFLLVFIFNKIKRQLGELWGRTK